jgi:peptide-methionine (S)-S-oxide reductase
MCVPATHPANGTLPATLLGGKKTTMVAPDEALAGRDEPLPVPSQHSVLGTPLQPPFPEGYEEAVFGMACFWGAAALL